MLLLGHGKGISWPYLSDSPKIETVINMENLAILPLAVIIDLTLGEYPGFLHPVVWMGQVINWEMRIAPNRGQGIQFIYGMAMVVITIALFAGAFYFLLAFLKEINTIAYIIVAAIILKSTFSWRQLRQSVIKVKS